MESTITAKPDAFSFGKHLPEEFFQQSPEDLARSLVGAILVKREGERLLAGRIVETEAYLSSQDARQDASSHAFRGKTARNEAMFGESGTLYVYQIYGIHLCANIVTEPQGIGSAVLLRAIEPLVGLEIMSERRGLSVEKSVGKSINLCRGPGKLAQAFGFTLQDNFRSVVEESCYCLPATKPVKIGISARIGITKAADLPLRFFDAESRFVSAHR